MKIATRATTAITHGATRRQVMLGRGSSIVFGDVVLAAERLGHETRRFLAAGGQSIASFRTDAGGASG